jgi:RNA recognition motif-containing protein
MATRCHCTFSEVTIMGQRLHVGNLSFDTTPETVRDAFAEVAEVSDILVVTDRETGRSRGFAFVTMATDDGARRALETMNGALLDGRAVRVNEAADRPGGGGKGNRHGGGSRRW